MEIGRHRVGIGESGKAKRSPAAGWRCLIVRYVGRGLKKSHKSLTTKDTKVHEGRLFGAAFVYVLPVDFGDGGE